jgi:heterotetrameric sarcosine oxidase gamma subunit
VRDHEEKCILSRTAETLIPRSALAGLSCQVAPATGVRVSEIDGMGMATVRSRLAGASELSQRAEAHLGLALPQGSQYRSGGAMAVVGIGPQSWLFLKAGAGEAFADELAHAFTGCASVVDQSSAYAVLRLCGPRVMETMSKLVSIDLHPRAFKAGDAASTTAALTGVIVWRREDQERGELTFDIAVYRSYAGSLWRALTESAAEFGVTASDQPIVATNI